VQSETVPRVQPGDRVRIDDLGFDDDNIAHVTARFGFQEEPNVPQALRLANEDGLECDIDVESPTYFLSRATIRVTDAPGLRRWRKRLFALSHNAANPIEYFGLPPERTITMGSQIPL
jgi:KUP system potassium uptake protein